jgi:putative endonuclease
MLVRQYFYTYMCTNPKKTVLYTGVTNNVWRRMSEHYEDSQDKRKSFAGKYFCYNLIYFEEHTDIRVAIAREKEIKGWTRAKKEALINSVNPNWGFIEMKTED